MHPVQFALLFVGGGLIGYNGGPLAVLGLVIVLLARAVFED